MSQKYELVVRRRGQEIDRVTAHLDLDDEEQLHRHLVAAVRRDGGDVETDLGAYALDVHKPNVGGAPETSYVAV